MRYGWRSASPVGLRGSYRPCVSLASPGDSPRDESSEGALPRETLRGVPPGREPDERKDAGTQEGVRGRRVCGREDGALEWKRGLQRPGCIGIGDRAQG